MATHTGYQQYKSEPRALTVGSTDKLHPTAGDIEGPFYKPGAPTRGKLSEAPTIILSGQVKDIDGTAIVDALLDFWQANEVGEYDNVGFNFRGKQYSQVGRWAGGYRLATVMPGDYRIADDPPEFRCAHIHVKVTAPGFKPLTTQLYFPAAPHNDTDHWFDPGRVVQFTRAPGECRFNFILERAGG